jgi:hypothetical protein
LWSQGQSRRLICERRNLQCKKIRPRIS